LPKSAPDADARAQRGAEDEKEITMFGPNPFTAMRAHDMQRELQGAAERAWMFGTDREGGLTLARGCAALVKRRMISTSAWLRERLPAVAQDRIRFGDLQR
jgi:hypothetical protein